MHFKAQYNGNISHMLYNTTTVTHPGNRSFAYTYDKLNRLTNAAFTGGLTGDALDENISYDIMGNITQLIRGGTGGGTLNYTSYTGNQLRTVTGYSARSYDYDGNGNATSDGLGKTIRYNMLNLPDSVGAVASYTYDASGQKLRNRGSDGTWDYVNGIVYHYNSIAFIGTEEGRAVPQGDNYTYQYNLKDHLGNVRVSIDQNSNAARVIQEDEYYSFGLRKPTGGYDLMNGNRYLYNGKEIQTDLANQYDYGARFYDPVIGRWSVPDPLADMYKTLSLYNYTKGNPISYVDIDGLYSEQDRQAEYYKIHPPDKKSIGVNRAIHYIADEVNVDVETGKTTTLSTLGREEGIDIVHTGHANSDGSFTVNSTIAVNRDNANDSKQSSPNEESTVKKIWYSAPVRAIIPDMAGINLSVTEVFGVGWGANTQLTFMTRGKDAGTFHWTWGYTGRIGVDAGGAVTGVAGWYYGNARNARFSQLLGKGVDLSAAYEGATVGAWGSLTDNGDISWFGISGGYGSGPELLPKPVSISGGYGATMPIKDF